MKLFVGIGNTIIFAKSPSNTSTTYAITAKSNIDLSKRQKKKLIIDYLQTLHLQPYNISKKRRCRYSRIYPTENFGWIHHRPSLSVAAMTTCCCC